MQTLNIAMIALHTHKHDDAPCNSTTSLDKESASEARCHRVAEKTYQREQEKAVVAPVNPPIHNTPSDTWSFLGHITEAITHHIVKDRLRDKPESSLGNDSLLILEDGAA